MAVDVHYLRSDGARAAAVVAADTLFSQVVAEPIAVVPEVPRYQPGEFCRRELPPLRAVLEGIADWGCWWSTGTPIWIRVAGPAWARMHTPSSAYR